MDPRVKLGLLACLGVLAVTLDRPLALGLLVLASLLPFARLGLTRRRALQGLGALVAVAWGTAFSQGLFYADHPRVPLLSLGPVTVWQEGVWHGLVQSLRFIALTLGGVAVAVSTPVDRLTAGLVALRVPFGLAFLAATALRFVPLLAEELVVVRRARARRGRPAWRRPPWRWLALEVALLRPVIARSLRRARALAESLDARGFDPLAPRASSRPLRLGAGEGALLAGVVGLTGAMVGLRVLFVLYTSELAWFPALAPVYAFVRAWL